MAIGMREEILRALSKAKSLDDLGSAIVECCSNALDAEVCTLWRRYTDDEGKQKLRLLAASAKAPQTLAQEVTYEVREGREGQDADGVTGYVAQTRNEVHVASFDELQERFGFCWKGRMDRTQWEDDPKQYFRSLSAFPLVLGKEVVGVFKLENKKHSQTGFSEDDRRLVREAAPDIALAVHFCTLLDSHSERLMQVPAQMVEALLRPFDPKQLVSEIVKTVADSLHAGICSLWLVDPAGKELRLAEGFGFDTTTPREQTYHLSDPSVADEDIRGITAWVAVRRKPFWANSWDDLKAHKSWKGKWDQPMWHDRGQRFRCLYAVPLLRQQAIIGVLKVENRQGEAFFTATDRALCGIMASLIVLVLELGQQLRASVIGEMAHLVRSPIGQIPMNLAMLEREIEAARKGGELRTDRIEKYLNIIKRAVAAAVFTSRELAVIARSGADLTVKPSPDRVALEKLVAERIGEMEPLLYNGITITRHFAEGVERLSVYLDITDRTRVQIAVDNILHNAVKYSRPNGVVQVGLEQESQSAILTIEDKGCGISKEDLPRIWEANFTRRARDHPQGTGMGLTMVKQVFDGLNWACKVSTEVNVGTTFTVRIPTAQGETTCQQEF